MLLNKEVDLKTGSAVRDWTLAWTSFLKGEGGKRGKEGRKVMLGKTIMCLCVYYGERK